MEGVAVPAETAARVLLYRFLSHCYTYPDPEFHHGLHQRALWQRLEVAGSVLDQPIHQAIAGLQASMGIGQGREELPLLDMQIEYTYLFINAVPHLPAPPYESAYSSEGLLMGKAVSQVLRDYRDAGLALREKPGLLPDHLGTELAFMAYLAEREAAELQRDAAQPGARQARQQLFLAEHLLTWTPAFLARVLNHARRPLYRRIAGLTSALLRFEERRLGLFASVVGRTS